MPRVSEAVSQLLPGVHDAAGDHATETIPVVVGCLTELAEKGIDPEDEDSYYNDEEDPGEVDPAIAAKGLDTGHIVVELCTGGPTEPLPEVEGRFRRGVVGRSGGT